MMEKGHRTMASILLRKDFDALLIALRELGYETVGPTVRDGAIVLDRIESVSDLPIGKTALLEPGKYRIKDRTDEALFGYAVGPTSAKQWLFPPRRTLFRAKVENGQIAFGPTPELPRKTAILGLRACDLKAIEVQDRVFMSHAFSDPFYQAMRKRLFLAVIDCAEPASTCFCTSMGGGPAADSGFDARITEFLDENGHRFLVEAGSDLGERFLRSLPVRPATKEDLRTREDMRERAEAAITKRLETRGIRDLLYRNAENPRWHQVAERCLACANCTMVCPTCFCSSVEEVTEVGSHTIGRDRAWDSCFNEGFSYIHGGSVRVSTMARYRQWMTHKLAAWIDQFDCSGCVGCGRCITWCPVGIDITEEAAAIRSSDMAHAATKAGVK